MRQRVLISGFLLALTLYLGYGVERTAFGKFILSYGACFGIYGWVVWRERKSAQNLRWYISLGILLRVILLFNLPNLSDDFYRFIWDGRLVAAGWDPLAHVPRWFMENQVQVPGLTPERFARLNSPDYFTVYPPLCQAVFAGAAWLSPASDWGAVVWIKVFLLLSEIGNVWLLSNPTPGPSPEGSGVGSPLPSGEGPGVGLLYALNPLAILEITGNCHFEGAMIFFLLLGLRVMEKGKTALGAVSWALATAAKLLPPLWLPLIWRWLGWRRGAAFVLLFAACCALFLAMPLRWTYLPNLLSSLQLYFRQFEFNASLYYLAKSIGWWIFEKNIGRGVGPFLGVLTAAAVLALAFFKVKKQAPMPVLLSAMTLAASIYLIDATTVHPWYVTVPLALGIASGWRFPIVWSGVAALSYSHYAGGSFQEKYAWIAFEYLAVVVVLLWEIRRFYSFPLSPTK